MPQKEEYSINDLIHDPSFRRMVKGTASPGDISRWNHWIETNDQNREKARQAISVIAGFEFRGPEQADVAEEWNRLYNTTHGKFNSKLLYHGARNHPFKRVYWVAAILFLGCVSGIGFYLYSKADSTFTQVDQITKKQTVRTDSSEQKTVKFSNGARIILNKNATVTYSLGLLHKQTIQVTLEGEAYFSAENRSGQNQPAFAVHTPDGTIRDIGTEFMVTVQEDRSRIVLQEGKVEVSTKNKANTSQLIAVQEGEMLEFDESSILNRQVVNATFYTSWATGSMQFNETTIQEFAEYVEQRFEVKVQIMDPALADIKLEGGIYYKSLGELVRSVSDIAKLPVYQSEDRETIYIGDKISNIDND